MRRVIGSVFFVAAVAIVAQSASAVGAQTPQPFPRAGEPPRQAPPAPVAPSPRVPVAQPPTGAATPDAATLGVAVYPTAQFLASYDAGRGQRYYIFGTTAAYSEVVGYYRTQLDSRGDEVYSTPATHMFMGGALGRYRDETMAFPPSVTVKDWTSAGSAGYPNPARGAQPAHFPTIVMIVPLPAGTPAR